MRNRRLHWVIGSTVIVLFALATPAHPTEANVLNAAVTISSTTSSGSAFCMDDGSLLSAQHVVGGSRFMTAESSDRSRRYRVEVVRTDETLDLALLSAEQPCDVSLSLADVLPAPGSTVYAIGSPIGAPVLTKGLLSDIGGDLLTAAIAVAPGNSGGPLLNAQDRVIGVVVQRDNAGNAYAVPLARIKQFLTRTTPTPAPTTVRDEIRPDPAATLLAVTALAVALMSLGISLLALTRLRQRRRPIVITLDNTDPYYKE